MCLIRIQSTLFRDCGHIHEPEPVDRVDCPISSLPREEHDAVRCLNRISHSYVLKPAVCPTCAAWLNVVGHLPPRDVLDPLTLAVANYQALGIQNQSTVVPEPARVAQYNLAKVLVDLQRTRIQMWLDGQPVKPHAVRDETSASTPIEQDVGMMSGWSADMAMVSGWIQDEGGDNMVHGWTGDRQ